EAVPFPMARPEGAPGPEFWSGYGAGMNVGQPGAFPLGPEFPAGFPNVPGPEVFGGWMPTSPQAFPPAPPPGIGPETVMAAQSTPPTAGEFPAGPEFPLVSESDRGGPIVPAGEVRMGSSLPDIGLNDPLERAIIQTAQNMPSEAWEEALRTLEVEQTP